MHIQNSIINDGTNQLERLLQALSPNYITIDERTVEDILKYMYQFSEEVAFYDTDFTINGNWQSRIEDILLIKNATPSEIQALSSHLILLITLSKLYGYAQHEINQITKNHLNYYYQEVLRVHRDKTRADVIYVCFELIKDKFLSSYLLKAGTSVIGKNLNGKALKYNINRDIVVNNFKIKELKTLFVERKSNSTYLFAAPVANSKDGIGAPLKKNKAYWATLGNSQVNNPTEFRSMINASIGFAISSPVLLLESGNRTIDVTIHFEANAAHTPPEFFQNNLSVWYSASNSWIEPSIQNSILKYGKSEPPLIGEVDHWQLKIQVILNANQPAFTFFNSEQSRDKLTTEWPALKVVLKPNSKLYDTLIKLKLDRIEITVKAVNVKGLILQNDLGVIDAKKPFLPFGPQPSINSQFYIGSREIFQKKLASLDIKIQWHDVPDQNFAHWYEQYGIDSDFGNSSFDADLEILLNNAWEYDLIRSSRLFNADAQQPVDIQITSFQHIADYNAVPIKNNFHSYDPTLERGFIRFSLSRPLTPFKAFGHKEFPYIYSKQALALARWDGNTPEPVLPNQPYTPTIKELSLDYSAKHSFKVRNQNEFDQVFQLSPFGFRGGSNDLQTYLVEEQEAEGNLFIGLERVAPPQVVNILFHFEEGTDRQDIVLSEEDIQWSFLARDKWIVFNTQEILVDETLGLKKSGVVSLIIPDTATNQNQLLNAELYWVKISAKVNAEGAAHLRGLYTNAVSATRVLGSSDDNQTNQAVEAETISKLDSKIVEIKSVYQPLPSTGGKGAEKDETYYTRVSERLRHKQRAIQSWDYERLVLNAFPNVFKVKCLPCTDSTSRHVAGAVTLIIVSNLRNVNASNPFEPRISNVVLKQIGSYVNQYCSPFAKIYVEEPVYEPVLVEAKIGFMLGYDPGYYSSVLNEALKKYLSPWAFEEGKDIVIGGQIYKSAILNFIEKQEYVDYVIEFKLYHKYSSGGGNGISEMEIGLNFEVATSAVLGVGEMVISRSLVIGEDVPVVRASTPKSILVSALNHRIEYLRPNEYACSGASSLGIGFMAVNVDFIVNE